MVHARHELALLETIKNQNQLTLSLEGWTDNSSNSIYALMALKGSKKKYFVDVLNLHAKRHTADNIFVAIKNSLKSKQIDFNKISALVTDSPSVMIKLRFIAPYTSSTLFIAKQILVHPSMDSVVKANKILVNYFTTSGFWREHLTTWQKDHGIKHGLQTLCKTRWYSMAKVCLGVQTHEAGFQKCLELLSDPLVDTPTMPTLQENCTRMAPSESILVAAIRGKLGWRPTE
ncbi:hypothetical protein PCANC_04246 [Puccinia coronata f. sp. avenae]|uniref:DUF659 domain-containing protein n=1 Tax=Puccinia coronata f. sp. avenae TaxID=200324 RepID=A0A2N5SDH0_9BASI|nr:hypothetical protein PCANC_20640 [Puccinia coronata f. sp. avenae]PLW54570.1 hypothetical protein PCANC_04246 [Puccinia coronata f. sp. avenae]